MATDRQHFTLTRLLTPAETAAILGVSRRWIYKLVADGELPALRLGDSAGAPMRVRPDDLNAWLQHANESRELAGAQS
jgi:excisionase family DNA binding protein